MGLSIFNNFYLSRYDQEDSHGGNEKESNFHFENEDFSTKEVEMDWSKKTLRARMILFWKLALKFILILKNKSYEIAWFPA